MPLNEIKVLKVSENRIEFNFVPSEARFLGEIGSRDQAFWENVCHSNQIVKATVYLDHQGGFTKLTQPTQELKEELGVGDIVTGRIVTLHYQLAVLDCGYLLGIDVDVPPLMFAEYDLKVGDYVRFEGFFRVEHYSD